MPVELGDRAGLAEVLDSERPYPVTVDGAEPGECRWMAVEHGDDPAIAGEIGQKSLNVGAGVNQAALAGAQRRGPAGVETVRRGDCEQADIAAVLGGNFRRVAEQVWREAPTSSSTRPA